MAAPASSVWAQLYYDGKEEPDGLAIEILPVPRNVGALAEAVNAKLKLDAPLHKMYVYSPGTKPAFDKKKCIRPGMNLQELIAKYKSKQTPLPTSDQFPLIVVAPDPPQQPPANGDVIPQLPPDTVAMLDEMVKDYSRKRRTIVLSQVTKQTKDGLMDMFGLVEKGVSWQNKPSLPPCSGFKWFCSQEDSDENRKGYMAHLGQMLQLPQTHQLADVQPDRRLLSVEFCPTVTESRTVRGTTDVVIAKTQHVCNHAVRNNIETLLELKTTKNMEGADHCPQTIGEHIAASYLNRGHAVVSVLTDLNTKWTFFWFAVCDGEMSLCKLFLQGENAAAEAKHLLDSLYDNSDRRDLPDTFTNRQSLRAVLEGLVQRKRARTAPDGDNEDDPNQDWKPSSSSGGTQPPGSNDDSSSEQNDNSGQQSNQHGTGNGGSAPMNMASMLSLFAPPADRDVANELDLLDMLDPDEQYDIVKSFAMKHIVPHMRG